MKIRCKKFGDDYTQVQGHEDTIIDFLKDHSFYLRWSYTHEKDKFYGSKFADLNFIWKIEFFFFSFFFLGPHLWHMEVPG